MKIQRFIVDIEMPEGDKISSTTLQDIIQADCDIEDFGRWEVTVREVQSNKQLDEAAKEQAESFGYMSNDYEFDENVESFKAGAE